MAKFCTNCGKKLEDGKVCDCQKSGGNNIEPQKLLEVCKDMFVKPIDTIKNFTKKENFSLSLILVGVLSIVAGLLAMAILKNSYSLIMTSMIGGSYSYGGLSLEIPYAKTFFTVLITVFILSFVYTGVLYLVNKSIFKRECEFKEVYSLYGVTSIIVSATTFLATILMFVNVYLGLIVFALGSILNSVYSYHGLKFLGNQDENKYGYIYLLTNVFFYIVIFIVLKIFS